MNSRFSLLICIVFITVAHACNVDTFEGGMFTHCRALSASYDLYWNIDKLNIVYGINVRGNQGGWFGLGLSISGGMKGADVFIAQKDSEGKYMMEDRFSEEYVQPQLDTHNDLTLVSATNDSISTTIIFSRKLDTCDSSDLPITDSMMAIIYAYGPGRLHYHGPQSRGMASINFISVQTDTPTPEDAKVFSLLTPAYQVPSNSTTYACSIHTLPHDRKYHITKITPVIDSSMVHHVVGYLCASPPPENLVGVTVACSYYGDYCADSRFYLLWGVGTGVVTFGADVGLPMDSSHMYIRLETHYNNPQQLSNVVDKSGLNLTYTAELRKYNLGVMALGTITEMIYLPPHETSIDLANECISDCTQSQLPPDGIHVTTVFPHMHLTGSKFKMQHIRDGVELPPLLSIDYYDFEIQRSYASDRVILPGDRIITHCIYNTMDRDEPTLGGPASSDEMCYGFIMYYPGLSLNGCFDLNTIFPNTSMCGNYTQLIPSPAVHPPYEALPKQSDTACTERETHNDDEDASKTRMIVIAAVVVGVVCGLAGAVYVAGKRKAHLRAHAWIYQKLGGDGGGDSKEIMLNSEEDP